MKGNRGEVLGKKLFPITYARYTILVFIPETATKNKRILSDKMYMFFCRFRLDFYCTLGILTKIYFFLCEMREETSGEKLWNAITHGVGVVGSVVALIFLIIYAVQEGTVWHIVSFSLYGATLLILYTMSTVYHSVSQSSCKKVFKKLDHVSIYLLIAGTYIPFCLTVLRGTWGWPIFWCIM